MVEKLRIWTFGGLVLKRGADILERGVPHRAKGLLVYLACTGRAHPRPVLADLLWDRGTEAQVTNNMRVLLSNLRRELGPYLTITRDSVAWNGAAPHWLDAHELAQTLNQAPTLGQSPSQRDPTGQLSSVGLTHLTQGLKLYRGEFLQGFSLRGGRGFEAWLLLERERWLLRIQDALREGVKAAPGPGPIHAGVGPRPALGGA